MGKRPPQWDGVDYKTWTQIMVVGGALLMWIGRFPDHAGDEGLSPWGFGLFMLFAALFMIPEGPRPPDD